MVTRFTARDGDLGPAGEFMFSMVQAIPNLETGVTDTHDTTPVLVVSYSNSFNFR